MRLARLIDRTGAAFALIGAGIAAAGAVERGRRPDPAALKRLGIDPQAFDRIGR